MFVFKNILARFLKHNLDICFQNVFTDYFAKILKNNLETVFKKILEKILILNFFKIGRLEIERSIDRLVGQPMDRSGVPNQKG